MSILERNEIDMSTKNKEIKNSREMINFFNLIRIYPNFLIKNYFYTKGNIIFWNQKIYN